MPQPPQLMMSFCAFTHVSAQQVSPGWQGVMQAPPEELVVVEVPTVATNSELLDVELIAPVPLVDDGPVVVAPPAPRSSLRSR